MFFSGPREVPAELRADEDERRGGMYLSLSLSLSIHIYIYIYMYMIYMYI